MQRYEFNPSMDKPLQFVHPVQVRALSHFLSEPFSDYIDYIILFGGSLDLSCGIDSDIDLYVISEHDPDVVYKEIYDRLRGNGRPFDILVSSQDDFEAEAKEFGTVEYNIAKEGLCLYAKKQDNIIAAG
ncbi:MAG: hypothetical protein FWC73_09700 [Defluviitaleaceae bacterium]|nr:hypothetical protein [Defluviitaleaceae bacterium]